MMNPLKFSGYLLSVIGLACVTATPQATLSSSRVINDPRPLSEVADLLEQTYAKPITYEESMWVWEGDLQPLGTDRNAKWGYIPKYEQLVLPGPVSDKQDLGSTLNQIVSAYHNRSEGARFRVIRSSLGFHIVPLQGHDRWGTLGPASSLLDASISVPIEERTASDHMRALCTAVSAATGTELRFFFAVFRSSFDQLFAAQPGTFSWGVSGSVARDALIDLVNQSATTVSWRLFCQASAQPQDRFCVLNVSPIVVNVVDANGNATKKLITYDRCGKCPHLFLPPAK